MEDTDVLPQGTRVPLSSKTLLCCTHWKDLALSCSALSYFQQLTICVFEDLIGSLDEKKHPSLKKQ